MQIRHKEFDLVYNSAKITVSSDFDSGNLEEVVINNNKIILTPAFDPLNLAYSTKHSSKTFFHFKITASEAAKLQLVIRRMNILQYFTNDQNFEDIYRICIGRCLKGSWTELLPYQKTKMQAMKRVLVDGNYQLHFNIDVSSLQEVYLAYHYPYSYSRLINYLQEIKDRVNLLNTQQQSKIYYCSQLLTQSLERRSINLLTLTQNSQIQEEDESRISKSIFPYFEMEGRPKKFNKPYILFTCRVHSGQTSASFALEGMVNFLLSEDKRAKALLKNFVFLIVPCLNPDGVFHGTYRMDTMGHNLNRFYNCAQSHKQPSIFAVQSIVNYYGNRVIFFMDLHSHPHPNKGSFIYGNCLQQIQGQTESQLFAKLLQAESRCFGYHWCSFSNSQMNSRDINQILTKDGSARVQVYKLLNLPFVYTMQMGYHGCQIKGEAQRQNKEVHKKDIIFTTQDYKFHGKGIIVTIFNIFLANVSFSLKQQYQKLIHQQRQQISKELIDKQERFRLMDSFIYRKIKNITEIIYNQVYQPFFKKYPFIEYNLNTQFNSVERGLGSHSTSQNNNFKTRKNSSRRKQASFQNPLKSRTIDLNDSKEKVAGIKSFKSTIQPRQHRTDIQCQSEGFNANQGNKFAKQVNLNFNPFPLSQRRKIYNVIGNCKPVIKKNITSLFFSNQKEASQNGLHEQQEVEQLFKSIDRDEFRDKKLTNFNPKCQKDIVEQQRQTEYLDKFWSIKNSQDRLILPKIPAKSEKLQSFKKFLDMQLQIQKQYDHKYRLHQYKNMSPVSPPHIKSTLRSNGLKMKSLIKPLS